MAINLPSSPRPKGELEPRLVLWGRETDPVAGGVVQPITRLGSRYAIDVTLPTMEAACARAWNAARLRSKNEGVTLRWTWPQAGVEAIGGAPRVKGAGQTGSILLVDGLTPGAEIPCVFFSFETAGRPWLAMVVEPATADENGEAALRIAPMLRVVPADNALLNFAEPTIEGFIAGDTVAWSVRSLRWVGISFTLTENK